jgi:hypothetical protein
MFTHAHAVADSILLLVLGLAACSGKTKPGPIPEQAGVGYDLRLNLPAEPISHQDQVSPIWEQRCAVCHGCYDDTLTVLPWLEDALPIFLYLVDLDRIEEFAERCR